MLNTAIILAGGFGTRLQTVVSDVPKPMAPVNGLPFLNYQLNYLKHYGIKNVIISVGYLAIKIKEYYKDSFNGMSIYYANELTPLGTGGGIRLALEKADSKQVIVLNGDSFFDVDLNEFYRNSYLHESDFSIAIRKVENAGRYGTIELGKYVLPGGITENLEKFFKVAAFKEKSGNEGEGFINGGVYILNKKQFFKFTKPNHTFSIEKDFFETQCANQDIGAFISDGYFIDIGVPEDYLKAQHDFKEFKYR